MTDDCRHGHAHFHHHHHHVGVAEGITPKYVRKLQWAMGLAILYFVVQFLGSSLSGSLALMADAGHKLADIGAIALALFAAWFSGFSVSPRKTFGYYRLEILAALVNAAALVVIAGLILWEAYQRFSGGGHVEIEGDIMLVVALIGLLINLVSAWVLYPARELSLNVKGALFHILADFVSSLGNVAAALAILLFNVNWLDTLISVVIAALVFYNAARLLGEALGILLEAAPRHLDVSAIEAFMRNQPGVTDVHDLHVWTITTGKDALLAHVRVTQETFRHETARELERQLRERFKLCHITVQLEPPGFEEESVCFP